MTFREKDDIIRLREIAPGLIPARGEGAHMEALVVKFGILAGLFGILGLIGLAALLGSVIWLIIRVANFDSILPALLCVVLSVGLTAGGLFLSPTPEVIQTEPLKAPWEAPLEVLKDQANKLKNNGPWARFFKDEAPPEDAPEEGEAEEPEMGASPENAGAKTVSGERNKIPDRENSA